MGRHERCVYTGFCWGNLTEEDHVEESGVDGRIILKLTINELGEGIDWNELVQNGDRWCVIARAVMSPRVS